MQNSIFIAGTEIKPGEEKQLSLRISRLPSRTPIEVPIFVARSKKIGPTLLILAGMHGDEVNGVEIIRRIITNRYHIPEKGTVICIPLLNVFGFILYSREVPDGKDVNRSFPGSSTGSLASMVAFHIMHYILPLIDYGIDFHTGGASRTNFPQVRCEFIDKNSYALAKAFNAPLLVNANLRPKSIRHSASKLEIPIIVYEGGESLRFDEMAIKQGVNGARRVMKHLGIRPKAPASNKSSIIIHERKWLRAKASGLFHTKINAGDMVHKDQIIGFITDPFGDFKKDVYSPVRGYVIGLNNNPVVNKGDALINLGYHY